MCMSEIMRFLFVQMSVTRCLTVFGSVLYFVSIVVFWFICPYVVCTRYLTIYQVFDNVWLFAIGGVCDYVSFSPSDFVDNLAGIVTMHFTRDL